LTRDRSYRAEAFHANHVRFARGDPHGCTAIERRCEPLRCDLTRFKPAPGLSAALGDNLLTVSWRGDGNQELRLRFTIAEGRPVIRDLSVRKGAGAWATLGETLTPEYHVVSGVRRMTTQQADPLKAAGIEITEDVIDKNRWYAGLGGFSTTLTPLEALTPHNLYK
jgi:hypothetical protein